MSRLTVCPVEAVPRTNIPAGAVGAAGDGIVEGAAGTTATGIGVATTGLGDVATLETGLGEVVIGGAWMVIQAVRPAIVVVTATIALPTLTHFPNPHGEDLFIFSLKIGDSSIEGLSIASQGGFEDSCFDYCLVCHVE